MRHVKLLICLKATICIVTGIKVNMQGSLSLGREVVESLSHYLGRNVMSGRRSLIPPPIEDPITLEVRSGLICLDLDFCQEDELQHFINEYIIILAKVVVNILNTSKSDFSNETYEEQLKYTLEDIRKILEDADMKVEDETEVYYWTHVIKRINARFQKTSVFFIDSYDHEAAEFNNKTNKLAATDLHVKIIIVTSFIERNYLIKLCSEHDLCSKSHECTKALNKLLIHFKTLPEDRIRLFIKYFYEALFKSPFYAHLSQATANEFQIILNDMSYANDTPTKDIMLSVLRTVEARMEMIQLNKALVVAHEILIAHTILSDIDHMFDNRTGAFTMFLNKFYDWMASDVKLEKHMHTILSDISKQISLREKDLRRKMIDEVKVFLDMTVKASEK